MEENERIKQEDRDAAVEAGKLSQEISDRAETAIEDTLDNSNNQNA